MDAERAKQHPGANPYGAGKFRTSADLQSGGAMEEGEMGRKVPLDRPGKSNSPGGPLNPKGSGGLVDKPDRAGGLMTRGKGK